MNKAIQFSLLLMLMVAGLTGCGSSTSKTVATPASAGGGTTKKEKPPVTLLNVSYDPTRELYAEINTEFTKFWKEQNDQDINVEQSHGGGGKQARAVIDGLKADVVTLALSYDMDQIAKLTGKFPLDWQSRLPNNSCPYTSTIVFLVRKGNPKGIKDWDDLAKEGIGVITPNPKTSGGARYNYLAAWGYALDKFGGDEAKAKEFVTALIKNVLTLDSGARGATTTFVQRGLGDVFLSWENEAFLAIDEFKGTPQEVEMVVPSVSIKAEPPVTVVDKNAAEHDALEAATGYLNFLYSPAGQQIVAKHHYRPNEPQYIDAEVMKQFPELKMFTVEEKFGSWADAQKKHFDDGGTFDAIYVPQQ